MYWPDIAYLKPFYKTALGRIVRGYINHMLATMWPTSHKEQFLGIGYTGPFLSTYLHKGNYVANVMPVYGGVTYWPNKKKNLTCTAEITELPFRDNTIERILVAHTLEHCPDAQGFLQEIWRLLTPGGKVLFIVPNRKSVWSHSEATPFGHGHPYSYNQLTCLLEQNAFTPLQYTTTLFMPPSHHRWILRFHHLAHQLGATFYKGWGGLLCVEAEKHLLQLIGTIEKEKIKKAIYTPVPTVNFDG